MTQVGTQQMQLLKVVATVCQGQCAYAGYHGTEQSRTIRAADAAQTDWITISFPSCGTLPEPDTLGLLAPL